MKKASEAMKDITHDRLIETLSYCEITGTFTRRVRVGRRWLAGQKVGHLDKDSGYVTIGVFGLRFWAHRLAWFYVHGALPEKQIDHRDGNRSNNAIGNLREATQAENSQNQRHPRGSGKVSAIGVGFIRGKNRWRAYIGVNGKQISLGRFDTEKEASDAYLAAKKIYHPFQTIAG